MVSFPMRCILRRLSGLVPVTGPGIRITIVEEKTTRGERIADSVARFGGSWTFVVLFLLSMSVYSLVNVRLGGRAWDTCALTVIHIPESERAE